MPRAKTILQSQYPYHVGARSHNKVWFTIPIEDVWRIMGRELYYINKVYNVKIHAFVLMSNHFHLLISTPDSNIDKAMWHFMTNVSRQINERANTINQIFGSRYFKCVIQSYHYFMHAYKYVYRNPVEGGLSDNCQSYPYSTLSGLLGARHLLIPVEEDTLMFPAVEDNLKWLNRDVEKDKWDEVKAALRKTSFVIAKGEANKKSALEINAL